MPKKVSYKLTAPYRASMTCLINAEDGLTHKEVCERVTHDDLAHAVVNWECIEDSWFDDWNASYRTEPRYVSPWDCTAIGKSHCLHVQGFHDYLLPEYGESVLSEHQKKQQEEANA